MPRAVCSSMYITRYNRVLFAHWPFLSCGRSFFFCALGSVARREPARTPRRRGRLWLKTVTRGLEIQSCTSPRGVVSSTQSHPGPCQPTYRSTKYPTVHVIYWILNVVNVVRHYTRWWKGISPTPICETCDHVRYNKIQSPCPRKGILFSRIMMWNK